MYEAVDVEHMIVWLECHASIQRGDGFGSVPVLFRDLQLDALRTSRAVRLERDVTVSVKPRQVGSSTTWLLAMSYLCKFCPGITIIWISQDEKTAKAIRRKWEIIIQSLIVSPGADYPKIKTNNSDEFQLDNSSVVVWGYAGNTKTAANKVGRGDTVDFMVWTELAYWDFAEETINSVMPGAEKSEPSIVIDSTSNGSEGPGEVFFDYAMAAYDGEPGHTFLFWPWWLDRDYRILLSEQQKIEVMESLAEDEEALVFGEGLAPEQIAWRRMKMRQHKDKFFEIYPETVAQAFISGESSIFDPAVLSSIGAKLRLSPPALVDVRQYLPGGKKPLVDLLEEAEGSREGWFRMFIPPGRHVGRVSVGIDSAHGHKDGDWQVLTATDEDARILAIGRFKTSVPRFADCAQRVCMMYGAYFFVEGEGSGLQVRDYIFQPQSDKMLTLHDVSDCFLEAYTKTIPYPKSNMDPGLVPINRKTRPIVVGLFKDFLGEALTEVPDEVILGEMRALEDKGNGKIEHAKNFHDDALFSFGYSVLGRRLILQGARSSRGRRRFQEPRATSQYGFFGYEGKDPKEAKRRHRRQEGVRSGKSKVPGGKIRGRTRGARNRQASCRSLGFS